MNVFPQTHRKRAYLLATGQTTSYGSGTGVDDGALQKGNPKSYTILTAGQYSGSTNITINGKTDTHSNNCVEDNKTGLMWSRTASASVGPNSNGTLPWTDNAGGESCFTYCAAANSAGLAGYSDWRVPNIYEIFSLTDFEAPTSAPNSTAFPSFSISVNFWSSTTGTSVITGAMVIGNFGSGAATRIDKATNLLLLLVRGG